MFGINEIVSILMKRDNISKDEALRIIKITRGLIYLAIENEAYESVEDILLDNLGLEMDYIFYFL